MLKLSSFVVAALCCAALAVATAASAGTQPAPVTTFAAASGTYFNSATPAIAFSVDLGSPTQCSVDAADLPSFADCTSPWQPAAPLAEGAHTFYVRADNLGAVSTTALTFFTDTVAPTLSITAPLAGDVVTTSTPDISFGIAGGTAQCKIDDGPLTACASPFVTSPLQNGPHTLLVRATDVAGNVTDQSVSFTIDDPDSYSEPGALGVASTTSKIKHGKFTAKLRVRFALKGGVSPQKACAGKATLRLSARISSKRSYKLTKRSTLVLRGDRCEAPLTVKLPANLKGKRLAIKLTFAGNAHLQPLALTTKTRRL